MSTNELRSSTYKGQKYQIHLPIHLRKYAEELGIKIVHSNDFECK